MKLRGIDLSAYIESTKELEGAPLFVINNTPKRGRLLFQCAGETGASTVVKVLDTWVPIDLTTQAQRSKLIQSTSFKDLLRKGALKIVAAEVDEVYAKKGFIGAEEALQSREVKDEYERVMQMMGTVIDSVVSTEDDDAIDLNKARAGANAGNAEQHASDIAQSIIGREEAGEEDTAILNAFRNRMSDFTVQDLTYIAGKSKIAKIKELAAELLNNDDDDEDSINLG